MARIVDCSLYVNRTHGNSVNSYFQVSSVLVLSNSEESGYTRPFYSEAMVAMVGIAAVGCYGGQLYLIDLGLDDIDLTPSCQFYLEESKIHKLTFVEPHEQYIAPKRRAAASKKLLIAVDFKSEACRVPP